MTNPNDCEHLQIETCYQYDSKKNRTVFWACPECRMLFQPKGLADADLVAENETLKEQLRDERVLRLGEMYSNDKISLLQYSDAVAEIGRLRMKEKGLDRS